VYAQEMAELPTNTSQFIMSPDEQDARELARARAAATTTRAPSAELREPTLSDKYLAEMQPKWAAEKAAGEQLAADRTALNRIIAEETAAQYGETGENAMALLREAADRGASFDELYPIVSGIQAGEVAAQPKRRARYEQNIADIDRRESDTLMNRATERAMDDIANRYRSQQAEEAQQRALAAEEALFSNPKEAKAKRLRRSALGLPMIGY
jgi:hypothetical protein